MKKLSLLAVLILITLSIWFSIKETKAPPSSDKPIIKIGATLPLSGTFTNVGVSLRNTFLLAQDDLKKRDTKYNYEFIIEDDAFDAKRVISNFRKFQSIDKTDAVISFASMTGNIISPLTEKNKIIYINFGASDKKVADGKYNFIHWNMPDTIADGMIDFYKKQNIKKVAFIVENDSGVITIEKSFTQKLKDTNIESKTYIVQPGEKDFRLLLQKIEHNDNPDIYLVMIWTESLSLFIKQYHEAGINKLITNLETFATVENKSIIEGSYYVDSAQSSDELTTRLRQSYPNSSSEFATGNVYDAIMLIVTAFEQAETKEQAVDKLSSFKTFPGISRELTQDDIGIFSSQAIIKHIKNGQTITFKE